MLSGWPLRNKLFLGIAALGVIVALLAFASIRGIYSYRRLARSVSHRANELPLAAELADSVTTLQLTARDIGSLSARPLTTQHEALAQRAKFRNELAAAQTVFNRYHEQLLKVGQGDPIFDDNRIEFTTLASIEMNLQDIDEMTHPERWIHADVDLLSLNDRLAHLSDLCSEQPSHLHRLLVAFAGEARGQYRAWIVLSWVTTVSAGLVVLVLVAFFYYSIFAPLRNLVEDCRRISAGNFHHRIVLRTRDELAELGEAMNGMTDRFRAIRDHLDQKVTERTRELEERTQQLIRSEQLASVGFLAAGVAHEINNPLASIAWCAESLESRVAGILGRDDDETSPEQSAEIEVLRKYLGRIQTEAFRCKGITEKLLDFSRLGNSERSDTDLGELVEDVIQMVQTIGNYRTKTVEYHADRNVRAFVSGPEIKQVILNLLTNALESTDADGRVVVTLRQRELQVELSVIDNGCGMSEEVLSNLFQPFFTRRREGQGTGLGLSITHRIVDDHHGTIEATSAGPGKGSSFRITLPRKINEIPYENHERQVA